MLGVWAKAYGAAKPAAAAFKNVLRVETNMVKCVYSILLRRSERIPTFRGNSVHPHGF
jgi:hypothetical protein